MRVFLIVALDHKNFQIEFRREIWCAMTIADAVVSSIYCVWVLCWDSYTSGILCFSGDSIPRVEYTEEETETWLVDVFTAFDFSALMLTILLCMCVAVYLCYNV